MLLLCNELRGRSRRKSFRPSPTSGASFSSMFFTYILENAEGKFYIGHTDNLENRLSSHNRTDKTAGTFTRKNGPWKLVWSEPHPTRPAAAQRERDIKRMKSARWIRNHLLNGRVPTRRDYNLRTCSQHCCCRPSNRQSHSRRSWQRPLR